VSEKYYTIEITMSLSYGHEERESVLKKMTELAIQLLSAKGYGVKRSDIKLSFISKESKNEQG
jgi:hypothetical protein